MVAIYPVFTTTRQQKTVAFQQCWTSHIPLIPRISGIIAMLMLLLRGMLNDCLHPLSTRTLISRNNTGDKASCPFRSWISTSIDIFTTSITCGAKRAKSFSLPRLHIVVATTSSNSV
jgi:hypothetical protein